MALAAQPQFLLLGEPMAGMSSQESAAVTQLLKSLKGRYTILLVGHDMDAVFALADRISLLVYGRIIFTGSADEIREHPELRAMYLAEEALAALGPQGIILQPTFLIADDLRSGRLFKVLPEFRALELGIYALYPTRKHVLPKVRLLIDYLVQAFADKPWPD